MKSHKILTGEESFGTSKSLEPRLISQASLVAVSISDGSYASAAEEGNAGGRLSLLETSLCLSPKPFPS